MKTISDEEEKKIVDYLRELNSHIERLEKERDLYRKTLEVVDEWMATRWPFEVPDQVKEALTKGAEIAEGK
jgi:hypothetical protein